MIMNVKNKKNIIDIVTEYGGSAASSAAGAVIGGSVAGPLGAVGGAMAGTAIENIAKKIGKEIKERMLSKSEEKKIDTVFDSACKKITDKLNEGMQLRQDDFFAKTGENRSSAEEIFEGTLFAAQRESEEKKIKYYANLYANIAFNTTISRPIANQLIKIAEQLTYRQIVILHAIGTHQLMQKMSFFKTTAYSSVSGLTNVTIASEIFELYRMSLISSKNVIFDSAGINPSMLSISGYGALIFQLMELTQLETDEDLPLLLMEIISFLTGKEIINT